MITKEQQKDLEVEFSSYRPLLSKTADIILDQEVSGYPIFVLHRQGINVGIPLDIDPAIGAWLVNASSLEEFVTKQLIETSKVDNFKAIYKDPKSFLCLFLAAKTGATFVFIPRN